MQPQVAIIIPCYNQGAFLPETLASVVAQTYDHWEAIIIDDGSSDNTRAIAERLIARFALRRIRLISQPNAGPAASRNAGIAITSAPYILPLDADDLIAATFLEQTVRLLEQQADLGFVTTNVRFFGAEQGSWSGGDPSAERLIYDCRMVVTTLFRRSAWQQAGGFWDRRAMVGYEDWDFWLRLIEHGWRGQLVPETLMWYRRSGRGRLRLSEDNDLLLRARLVQSHPTLYPAAFHSWATNMLDAAEHDKFQSITRWRWYVHYALLVARHAPHELPKALFRPLFKGIDPRYQMHARRLAQLLRISKAK